ncbi:MAG: glutamate racemase [Clostridiales bacterium]|nr:glutamate racemase [Clostridiales bacterium]
MNQKRDPIGVFDSGVGGISTLREMIRELPDERFIYFGDAANAPYGTKSTQEVIACVRGVVEHLMKKEIKALVIACNTATGAAAATLRKELSIPVIGMEPALKPAAQVRKHGSVLVLATPLTLHQEKFENLMKQYGQGAVKVPCPGLMEIVEKDDGAGALHYLQELFSRFDLDRVDAVVLGCTHYVFLKDMIRDLLPERIAITDGNAGTARQLKRVLAKADLLNGEGPGSVEFETSGTQKDLELMKKLADFHIAG